MAIETAMDSVSIVDGCWLLDGNADLDEATMTDSFGSSAVTVLAVYNNCPCQVVPSQPIRRCGIVVDPSKARVWHGAWLAPARENLGSGLTPGSAFSFWSTIDSDEHAGGRSGA